MPDIFYPSKARCLRLDEANMPCSGVFGYMAFVPIPGWKGGKEVAEQDGLKGAVILMPAKCSWRCRYVFDVLPVEKEAVIAVVRVGVVDETARSRMLAFLGLGTVVMAESGVEIADDSSAR